MMRSFDKIKVGLWKLATLGLPLGPHITRYFMYEHLRKVGNSFPSREGAVLSISHSGPLCDVLGLEPTKFIEANYPEHNILSLPFPDQSFDFVVSDQVLEHIEGDPQQAINESQRVLRPKGIAIHTTCFMNPSHSAPGDYWRFTPSALRWLMRDHSLVLDCNGWGNFEMQLLIKAGFQFYGIPHKKWHPFHKLAIKNDPKWSFVTWIVAQK